MEKPGKEAYLYLQHSESVVAQMSATVFAALTQQQQVTPDNQDELVQRAVAIAVKLAVRAEAMVKSNQEWVKKPASSLPLMG